MRGLGYSPEDITAGGLRVYTTLDQDVNRLAQRAAANQVAQLQSEERQQRRRCCDQTSQRRNHRHDRQH